MKLAIVLAALSVAALPAAYAQQTVGSIAVGGSAHVRGPVTVTGTLSVDGNVHAKGPITAAWFASTGGGYPRGPGGALMKEFKGPLTVHGAMVVHGDLYVDGPITVTGALEAGGEIDADGPMVERESRR